MSRVLLDTHIFIWWCNNDTGKIPPAWVRAISSQNTEVFVSSVSAIEIAIKRKKGKLKFPTDISGVIRDCQFVELPLLASHGELSGDLPPVHSDPFDRLLIAQAKIEGMRLASLDSCFSDYPVGLLKC